MTHVSRIRWINATGIVLAFFGYALSPWLGSRSALSLLVELANFLRTSSPGADIGRQQAIFAILGGILLCLIFQALSFGLKVRRESRGLLFQEVIFAILALGLLLLLLVAFQANSTGLFVTALSVLVAALAALLDRMGDTASPPAQASARNAAPDEPVDPMLDFQRRVAQAFHQARSDKKPFTLGMIGIRYFDEVTNAFGKTAAQEMLDQLTQFIDSADPDAVVAAFSTGSVMVALPGVAKADAETLVADVTERMVSHGFPGEMLLPAGRIYLDSFVVSFPKDGDNLARLTETVLSGYAETITRPYSER
ncbi:MAG: GGDEF domain-containing protein [Caldilineaceae bacterium]|nr:GGDEF domain-containing protein [Caldilineaceae bacterium]